jgi:hypothetical protein
LNLKEIQAMRVLLTVFAMAAVLSGCNQNSSNPQADAGSSAASGVASASVAPAAAPAPAPVSTAVSTAPAPGAAQAPAQAQTQADADGVPAVCHQAIEAKRVCFDNAAKRDDAEGHADAASRNRTVADGALSQMMDRWKARKDKSGLQAECSQMLAGLEKIPACRPQ